MTFLDRLEAKLGAGRVTARQPLAPFTTFKVGGHADWFAEPRGRAEVIAALEAVGATVLRTDERDTSCTGCDSWLVTIAPAP